MAEYAEAASRAKIKTVLFVLVPATAAALGVVELPMSGVGGDGFIMIFDADSQQMYGINATGPAPSGATREFYLERGGIPMKGILSVSIPGLVDGWLKAHKPAIGCRQPDRT